MSSDLSVVSMQSQVSQSQAQPVDIQGFEVLLAQPRGFCAGVDRAIEIVERALAQCGAPIYVRHEIVHNRYVVESLRDRGAVFVESLDEVPRAARWCFPHMGCRRRCDERRCSADFEFLTPPVRW